MVKKNQDGKTKSKKEGKKDDIKFVKKKKVQVDSTTKELRSLYNRLMQNNNNDKTPLVKKVLTLIDNNFENYCYKHDGCRILQGCLKYGSKEQKKIIIDKLLPLLFKIICGKYSLYLSGKIFKYADSEQRKKILNDTVRPNFKELLKYSGGISFTKMMFTFSNSNFQDELINIYIQDYFKIPLEQLKIIKEQEQDNEDIQMEDKTDKNIIVDNSKKNLEVDELLTKIKSHLDKQLEKEINKNFIFHGFLNKIFDFLDEKTQIYISELFDDDISFFMDSNYGYELLMKLYSVSSAKTRKKIIRFVRDNYDQYLSNEKGIYFIIKIILFTDDTVIINKTFMNSIMDKLSQNLVEQKNLIKIVWNIISPFNKKCNNEIQQKLLSYSTPNSNKKSIEKRQTELIDNIYDKLVKMVIFQMKFFFKDLFCSFFFTDFIQYIIKKKDIENLEHINNAIKELIEKNYQENKDKLENCILMDKTGHVVIKRIMKELYEEGGESKKYGISLAEKVANVIKCDMQNFLNSRGIFIIVQLMENNDMKKFINKDVMKFKSDIMKNKDNEKLTGMQLLAKIIQ